MKSEQPITKIKAYKIEQTKKVADAYIHAKKAGNVKVTTLPISLAFKSSK
jgi:hypothetical protein